ncbi:hypothetical protein MES4922_550010 [Mesorhizobium ventifaucium]|uniref:Uncharacterized protein n=1 Tax=Mesorhizobium ventifaucium TaxID=666020 RepID=A0ABN8K924_9HYPH|nr:hypothetical protein MES4922_550010 [Mesorhizobium ventifaucium]
MREFGPSRRTEVQHVCVAELAVHIIKADDAAPSRQEAALASLQREAQIVSNRRSWRNGVFGCHTRRPHHCYDGDFARR